MYNFGITDDDDDDDDDDGDINVTKHDYNINIFKTKNIYCEVLVEIKIM
jgi:hypothetical protein